MRLQSMRIHNAFIGRCSPRGGRVLCKVKTYFQDIRSCGHAFLPWLVDLASFMCGNPWRRSGKKPSGDITICRLYQGLRFHTQREDGANPTSIQPTKRNRSSDNDSLQKHQSESTFTRWRHGILRHCCRSTTRRHASPVPLYHLRA